MFDKVATPIDKDQVASVYNGEAHKCCCGCCGTHTKNEPEGSRKVSFVVNKLNANLDKVEDGGSYWAFETETRVYIAYKRES